MQLINVIASSNTGPEAHLLQLVRPVISCEPEADIRRSIAAFLQTPDGQTLLEDQGRICWRDVITQIPESFWEAHGQAYLDVGRTVFFTVISTVHVDLDEDLSRPESVGTGDLALKDLRKALIGRGHTELAVVDVAGLLTGLFKPEEVEGVQNWIEQCHTPPGYWECLDVALCMVLKAEGVSATYSNDEVDHCDVHFLRPACDHRGRDVPTLVRYNQRWYWARLLQFLESIQANEEPRGRIQTKAIGEQV